MKKSVTKRSSPSKDKDTKKITKKVAKKKPVEKEEEEEPKKKKVAKKKTVEEEPKKVVKKKKIVKSKVAEEEEEPKKKKVVKTKDVEEEEEEEEEKKKKVVKKVRRTPKEERKKVLPVDEVLEKLVGKEEKPLLTEGQVEKLVELKFANGEKVFELNTEESRGFVSDMSWLMGELGFDAIYEFLSKDWERLLKIPVDESADFKRSVILRKNPIFDKNRENLVLELYYFKNPIMIAERSSLCVKCGSMETLSSSKQSRSADESTSIKVKCLMCGHGWQAQ